MRSPLTIRSGFARTALTGVALTTAMAMGLTIAPSPASAVSAVELENLSTITEVQTPGFVPAHDMIPAVESLLGRGTTLAMDATGVVTIGGQAESASSALVRVTIMNPAQTTTVWTGTTSPVLRAEAGTTASATALLPVAAGSVPLWADVASEVRVEPIAYFSGGVDAPGATIALPDPVRRAETQSGLAGPALTVDPLWIGLTGAGGVPAAGVRSAYVTFAADLAAADSLVLGDGQSITLPAGPSVVTTVVTLDASGGITVQLGTAGNSASLIADIQGWVSEAPSDASRVNSIGSYVSSTETADPVTLSLSPVTPATDVVLADHDDVDYALALVSSSASGETTALADSAVPTGRATGTAIDSTAGALPQLALIPVDANAADLSIHRGAAAVTIQPLGGFLGESVPIPNDTASAPSIAFTSPLDRSEIDVSETGLFTLNGTVAAGANAIDRVEISSPSVGFIGTAELTYGGDEITWSFTAAAPDDGDFDYVASVFDRGAPGTVQASDRVTLSVLTPNADDAVVSPDVRVFNTDPAAPDFTVIDTTHVRFTAKPDVELGTIIASGPTAESPNGFSGRLVEVNLTAAGWAVTTSEVAMEEMFFQFDLDADIDFEDGMGADGTAIIVDRLPDEQPAEQTLTGTYAVADDTGTLGEVRPIDEVVYEGDEEAEHADLLLGDNVDLELNADDIAPEYVDDFAVCTKDAGGAEPTGDQIDDDGNWIPASDAPAAPTACDPSDLQKGTIDKSWSLGLEAKLLIELRDDKLKATNLTKEKKEEAEKKTKQALETGAALTVEAKAQATLQLHIVFDVKFKFKWKIIPTGVTVNEFRVQVTTNVKASAALDLSLFREQSLALKQDLATVYMPTVVVMVGAVPVPITNELDVSIGIDSVLKATITLPLIGIERTDVFGFTYSTKGGLARIKNEPVTRYVDPALEPIETPDGTKFGLSGEVVVGPKIEYASKIYGFAGPAITLSAGAGVGGEASVELFPDNHHYSASIEVFLAAGLTGEAKLKLVKWQLLSITIFNLQWRHTLFSKSWEHDTKV